MSWGVDIVIDHKDGYQTTIEVVYGHTYNLTNMWRKAGIFENSSDLEGRTTREVGMLLAAGLIDAVTKAAEYRALEPENGWGDYDGFLKILTRFTELAWAHPTGTLRWNG